MIQFMIEQSDFDPADELPKSLGKLKDGDHCDLARVISGVERGKLSETDLKALRDLATKNTQAPVLGITGTGGAGKSSLTDELIRRLRLDQDDTRRVAVISIDPSRRKSGGALLGDRIRMNAISPWGQGPRVFMRSLATRDFGSEISAALPDVIAACKAAGFDPGSKNRLTRRQLARAANTAAKAKTANLPCFEAMSRTSESKNPFRSSEACDLRNAKAFSAASSLTISTKKLKF